MAGEKKLGRTRISQYDYLLATTPDESAEASYDDPSPDETEDAFRLAAAMVREALRLAAAVTITERCDGTIRIEAIGHREHIAALDGDMEYTPAPLAIIDDLGGEREARHGGLFLSELRHPEEKSVIFSTFFAFSICNPL